jgi:Peptidase A4 family
VAAAGANSFRRAAIHTLAVASVAALLAGCSGLPRLSVSVGKAGQTTTIAAGASATSVGNSTNATPAAAVDIPVISGPSAAATDAIRSVIERGNQEEVQAIAAQDSTVMRDTATAAYYDQLTQTYNDLVNSGVTAIQLVKLNWGPITIQGTTSAQATTVETWLTTLADGSTVQDTATNVYTLVFQDGAWKVQDDQHPDTRAQQPPAGNTTAPAPVTPDTSIAPASSGHSGNWSGYNATGGAFTSVSGNWTVPQVGTVASGADATWVGIGGVTSRDLIQAGTQAVVQSGQVVYSAWWETLPQTSQTVPLNVSAGDKMSVSITQQSDGTWLILIRDTTTGGSFRKSVAYQSSLSSAEWVEEAPAGRRQMIPLDNFGSVSFASATTVEDGQQRTLAQAGGQPITMYNQAEQALAQPSVLGADGASFTVARTSATNASSSRLSPGRRFGP